MDALALMTNGWPTSGSAAPVVEYVSDFDVLAIVEEELHVEIQEVSDLDVDVEPQLELTVTVREIF